MPRRCCFVAFRWFAAWALCALPLAGFAQTYPSQPVTLVVSSAAGGIVDTVARLMSVELTRSLKVPVIVEVRAGASGIVATTHVSKAPRDGHTVLFTYTAHVQTPALRRNLPYDPIRDFAPISHIALSPTIIAVQPGFPANTLEEFIALVRASPGKYSYGTYGNATSAHIAGELLKREARLDMAHVPYKGAAPLVSDLLAGHVPIAFVDTGTPMPHLKLGRLKALVINGTRRSSILTTVPTFLESGYKGFEQYGWIGALFPAGVPADRVKLMSEEMARIVKSPAIQQRLRELNLEPLGSTAEEFAATLSSDLASWSRLVTELGIQEN
ncbi:MAG: tripartite tricarboxylate transporter substrate binding protein [Burkholderiales bacterium]|nr:tripartite tricarboxylate transporter substrate binding protein [Burkholderiales bacterium]